MTTITLVIPPRITAIATRSHTHYTHTFPLSRTHTLIIHTHSPTHAHPPQLHQLLQRGEQHDGGAAAARAHGCRRRVGHVRPQSTTRTHARARGHARAHARTHAHTHTHTHTHLTPFNMHPRRGPVGPFLHNLALQRQAAAAAAASSSSSAAAAACSLPSITSCVVFDDCPSYTRSTPKNNTPNP